MRYGLPREEKPKKKWKSVIENELRSLKVEVSFLKEQLNDVKNHLATWKAPDRVAPFSFMQGFSRNENRLTLFSQNDNSNNFSNKSKTVPQFTTAFNMNSNERPFPNSLPSPQGCPFPTISMGADRPRYESTWDYDTVSRKSLRMHSISCMPHYKDKSIEELRYEDYILKGIGFSNQIQRFKDSIQRSARSARKNFSFTPKNWKPMERKNSEESTRQCSSFVVPWYLTPKPPKPWPFGPSSGNKKESNTQSSNSVASSVPQTIDLKLQNEQDKSEPFFFVGKNAKTQDNSGTETKTFSDFVATKKDENLSNQILFELKKMGEQMLTINDRLSRMDSNLSDMNSQVSVMDSKLSAVDMFVTMQRFDKKWQDLETRLINLETPSPAKVTTFPTNVSKSKDTRLFSNDTTLKEKMNISSSFEDKKINNTQTSDFEKPDATPVKHESERLSMDTSDINLSDFVRSVSCTDTTKGSKITMTLSSLDSSTASDSPLKTKLDNASIEMADLKSFHLPLFEPASSALVKNSSPQENDSLIRNSESVCSVPTDNDEQSNKSAIKDDESKPINDVTCTKNVTLEGKKIFLEPEIQIALDKDSNGLILNDPLGVTEQKDSSAFVSTDLLMKEVESDTENEFVIVERSDVNDSVEDNSKVKTISPLNEASSSSEFKMCNDITEYLEINLGKKKNLVYEFGFEVKPSYSPDSEGHEKKLDGDQENKASASPADDSFQKFKINFIENKSVHEKQSSPFVLCSKSSEKTPDDKLKNKIVIRARRQRMLSKA